MARYVIVHGHMFKNAGTTFDWSLERNFRSGFVDHRDDKAMKEGHEYLRGFIHGHPKLKALSSHHMQFPEPKMNDIEILPAVLFRHPIDRVKSVYKFERQQESDTPGAIAAKEMGFSDYVKWRLTEAPGPTIRDFQTRYCTRLRATPMKPVSNERFEEARAFINRLRLLGIVERYDESMVVFEEYLKEYSPKINLAYVRQNVGQAHNNSIDERIEATLNSLGEELSADLIRMNKCDMELYEEACCLLDTAISGIHDFDVKLKDFKSRCDKLQNQGGLRKLLNKVFR